MSEKTKYIINPHLKIIRISANELLIKHSMNSIYSKVIEDESGSGMLSTILDFFSKENEIENFFNVSSEIALSKQELQKFIEQCIENDILIDSKSDTLLNYLKLHYEYVNGQHSESIIGIIGFGMLGHALIENLIPLKFRKFLVANDTEVSEKDTNIISEKRYSYKLQDLKEIVQKSDFILCSQDFLRSNLFHKINNICIEEEKPWTIAFIDGSECNIGPIFIPNETSCYNEYEIQTEASLPISNRRDASIYKEYMGKTEKTSSNLSLPTYYNIVAAMLATEIFKFLETGQSNLLNSSIKIDFETMEIDYINILKLPRCPACENHSGFKNMFL